MIRYRRGYRIIFCLAGAYNILWGLYAAWDPQWLFRFAGLPLSMRAVIACPANTGISLAINCLFLALPGSPSSIAGAAAHRAVMTLVIAST